MKQQMTLLSMGSIPLYFLACRSICQVMRSKVSLCYHFHFLKHLPSQFCIVYGYHVHLKPSSLQIIIYVYKSMVLLKPNFGKLNESHDRSKAHYVCRTALYIWWNFLILGYLTSQYENFLLDSDPPRLYTSHSISHLKVGEYMWRTGS